jgi:hypothetical protein
MSPVRPRPSGPRMPLTLPVGRPAATLFLAVSFGPLPMAFVSVALSLALHTLPALPLVTRGLLVLSFRELATEPLGEDELDRESGHGLALALAGISFAAVVAVLLMPAPPEVPLYFLTLSFLAFLAAMGGERYKSTRWQDQTVAALRDVGVLALLMGLFFLSPALVNSAALGNLIALAVVGWLVAHGRHLLRVWMYLSVVTEVRHVERRETPE